MSRILKAFEEHKFVAQIRSSSAEDAEKMIRAAMAGGIRLFEVSVYTPQAFRIIESYGKKGEFVFGAGNIMDGEVAQRAISAGAQFISSQYTDLEIINVAKHYDSFVIQGAFTPTEAVKATQDGADLIKIYPSDFAGGVEYLRTLRYGVPSLKFVADHGVTFENCFEFLKHAVAVTLRGAIFDRLLLRSNNWAGVTERAREFTEKLEQQRAPKSAPSSALSTSKQTT